MRNNQRNLSLDLDHVLGARVHQVVHDPRKLLPKKPVVVLEPSLGVGGHRGDLRRGESQGVFDGAFQVGGVEMIFRAEAQGIGAVPFDEQAPVRLDDFIHRRRIGRHDNRAAGKALVKFVPKPFRRRNAEVKLALILQAGNFPGGNEIADQADIGQIHVRGNEPAGKREPRPFRMPGPEVEHPLGNTKDIADDHQEFRALGRRRSSTPVDAGKARKRGAASPFGKDLHRRPGLADHKIEFRQDVLVLHVVPLLVGNEDLAASGLEHMPGNPFEENVQVALRVAMGQEPVGQILPNPSKPVLDFFRDARPAEKIGVYKLRVEAGFIEQVDDDARVVHQAIGVLFAYDIDGDARGHRHFSHGYARNRKSKRHQAPKMALG